MNSKNTLKGKLVKTSICIFLIYDVVLAFSIFFSVTEINKNLMLYAGLIIGFGSTSNWICILIDILLIVILITMIVVSLKNKTQTKNYLAMFTLVVINVYLLYHFLFISTPDVYSISDFEKTNHKIFDLITLGLIK